MSARQAELARAYGIEPPYPEDVALPLWIGVQSGTPPGHTKILKSRVKSGKGG